MYRFIHFFFFFFNDTATTEIYTLSLHDALPILWFHKQPATAGDNPIFLGNRHDVKEPGFVAMLRSEEHTSELQSHLNLVCRLLLEKKKNQKSKRVHATHTRMQY